MELHAAPGERRLLIKYTVLTLAIFLPLLWAFLSIRNLYPIAAWKVMMAGGDLGVLIATKFGPATLVTVISSAVTPTSVASSTSRRTPAARTRPRSSATSAEAK